MWGDLVGYSRVVKGFVAICVPDVLVAGMACMTRKYRSEMMTSYWLPLFCRRSGSRISIAMRVRLATWMEELQVPHIFHRRLLSCTCFVVSDCVVSTTGYLQLSFSPTINGVRCGWPASITAQNTVHAVPSIRGRVLGWRR